MSFDAKGKKSRTCCSWFSHLSSAILEVRTHIRGSKSYEHARKFCLKKILTITMFPVNNQSTSDLIFLLMLWGRAREKGIPVTRDHECREEGEQLRKWLRWGRHEVAEEIPSFPLPFFFLILYRRTLCCVIHHPHMHVYIYTLQVGFLPSIDGEVFSTSSLLLKTCFLSMGQPEWLQLSWSWWW